MAVQNAVHPSDEGSLIDPSTGITGATLATTYARRRYLLVGVSGTYRIYGLNEAVYMDTPLIAGHFLPFMSTKITTTGDAAVNDRDIIAYQ